MGGDERAEPNVPEGVVPLSVADMELKNPPEIMGGLKEYLDQSVLGYPCGTDSFYEAVEVLDKEALWMGDKAGMADYHAGNRKCLSSGRAGLYGAR